MASVRDDLDGVVTAYDAAGVPVTLSAGDDIPEGVEVGEHVLAGPKAKAPAKKAAAKSDEK